MNKNGIGFPVVGGNSSLSCEHTYDGTIVQLGIRLFTSKKFPHHDSKRENIYLHSKLYDGHLGKQDRIGLLVLRQLKESGCHISSKEATEQTFSETRLLLPFNSSGAIQGSVPRTPPEISVWHLTFDRPQSPTYNKGAVTLVSDRNH